MPDSQSTVRDHATYAWGITAMRLAGLAAIVAVCTKAHPGPSGHGRGLVITVALAVASAAWVLWVVIDRFGDHRRSRPWSTIALATMGVFGGLLGGISSSSPGVAIAAVAALAAGGTLTGEITIGIAVASAVTLAVSTLVVGGSAAGMLGWLVLIGAGLGTGFIRLGYAQRADQAELLLEQIRLTQAAEARAAALGERTRIAREIHDILAHSLGALAMQVEAAHAQLTAEGAPVDDPHVIKATACVERASQLVRSGLTETRQAVHALREDTGLLPDMLATFAASRAGEGEAGTITVHVSGTVRHLPADATLALFRTAQESVTNAAKHAPGEPVTLDLAFAEDQVVLTAVNPLPPAAGARPLGATGGGYGLTGLRERAELAGGSLTAEAVLTDDAVDNTWRVCVTIPV